MSLTWAIDIAAYVSRNQVTDSYDTLVNGMAKSLAAF